MFQQNISPAQGVWRRLILVFVALLTALIAACKPIGFPEIGLDPSWYQALAEATDSGRIFGQDVVFTFGPLHQAYTSQFSEYLTPLIFSRLFFFSIWFALQVCIGLTLGLWVESTIAVATMTLVRFPDCMTFLLATVCVLVPPALVSRPTTKSFLDPQVFLALAMLSGVLVSTLVKLSFLGAAVPSMASVYGYQIARLYGQKKRVVLSTLAALFLIPLAVLLVAWAIPNHGMLNSFLGYYSGLNLDIVRGYAEAMSYEGISRDMSNAFVFLLLFVVSMLLLWTGFLRRLRVSTPHEKATTRVLKILTLGSASSLYWIVFKAFFVRDDILRIFYANLWAACFLSLLLVIRMEGFPSMGPTWIRKLSLLVPGLPLLLGFVLMNPATKKGFSTASNSGFSSQPVFNYLRELGLSRVRLTGVEDSFKLLIPSQRFKLTQKKHEALQVARKRNELYSLPAGATVDSIPWEITSLLAQKLDYKPRPIPQSFAVFTKSLQKENRDHFLRSTNKPDYFILDAQDIDGRLPISLDSPLILTLPDFYDYSHRGSKGSLVLKRKPHFQKTLPSGGQVCHPVSEGRLPWQRKHGFLWMSTTIALPLNRKNPLVLNTEVDPSFYRSITAAAYKPSVVKIEYLDQEGRVISSYRLIPNAGLDILVYPLIRNNHDLLSLWKTSLPIENVAPSKQQPPGKITSFRLVTHSLLNPFDAYRYRLTEYCRTS